MVRSGDLAGGRDATENRRDPGIFFVCGRLGSVRAVLSGNFRIWRDQRVWRPRLRDERRRAPGAAAVQEGGSRATPTPHDGDGELHLAFAIASAEFSDWEAWLAEKGIAIEEKKKWDLGGWSLYFRDPDRHLLELATPGTWTVY